MKRAHRFKVQKKQSGKTIETKPIFDFEGRKALAWPASLELFTAGEHLLGMIRVKPSLPWAAERSRWLHWVAASLFVYDSALVPPNLPAQPAGRFASSSWTPCSSHGMYRKLRCSNRDTWSLLLARCPCSKKDATDKHLKIVTVNQHAQHDLLEFECLPSLQRSPLTLC